LKLGKAGIRVTCSKPNQASRHRRER
jgi:hypothetical protein